MKPLFIFFIFLFASFNIFASTHVEVCSNAGSTKTVICTSVRKDSVPFVYGIKVKTEKAQIEILSSDVFEEVDSAKLAENLKTIYSRGLSANLSAYILGPISADIDYAIEKPEELSLSDVKLELAKRISKQKLK